MNTQTSLVVTTIAQPTPAMRALAMGASSVGWDFLVIGDVNTPGSFQLPGAEFISVEEQLKLGSEFAPRCPLRHYARKNIGYLLAIARGAQALVETDDDNLPLPAFFGKRELNHTAPVVTDAGWVNVYRYFTETLVWPRGLPLNLVRQDPPDLPRLAARSTACPIQQGLADDNPDVDAVYRLVRELPVRFEQRGPVALGAGSWCPFNSQNTTWFARAFELMYLPGTCSPRLTDIWRGLVAQRIAWANDWSVLHHAATVRQERNEHDLMKDFEHEVAGYRHNSAIVTALGELELASGETHVVDNLKKCYGVLVERGYLPREEMGLLEAWLTDVATARGVASQAKPARRAA